MELRHQPIRIPSQRLAKGMSENDMWRIINEFVGGVTPCCTHLTNGDFWKVVDILYDQGWTLSQRSPFILNLLQISYLKNWQESKLN